MQRQHAAEEKSKFHEAKPILSVLFIVITLFVIVFLKMEERRRGYGILKLSQEHRLLIERKREKNMMLAKVTRPQLVEKLAQAKFTLRRVQNNQIIHLTGSTPLAREVN